MNDVTELIEQLRHIRTNEPFSYWEQRMEAADTLEQLQSRIELLEGVYDAAKKVDDGRYASGQRARLNLMRKALVAVEDKT